MPAGSLAGRLGRRRLFLLGAGLFTLAHAELFATVIPGFPAWPEAGLVGSLLWLGWMALLGVFLLRAGGEPARERARGAER